MAALSQDSLTCAICLDLLKDPVTLPCGHSYCMDCIQDQWNYQGVCTCPQCRQNFSPRPVLSKNITMAALVEDLQATGTTAPPADDCYAAAGEVSCDVCTGRKFKAVRSCLQCVVSFCEHHLQPHHEAEALQRHQLVEPSDLQEHICSQHNKLREIFCRTDQQLLCYLCSVDQHKGHDTVSSDTERAQRQARLPARRNLLFQSLNNKKKDLQMLQQEAQDISCSAQKAMKHNGDNFRELALLLEKRRSEVEQQIQSKEQTQLRRVQELQDQVQQDITELKRSISELDTLSETPNCNQLILCCPLLSSDAQMAQSRTQTRSRMDFEDIFRTVSALRDQLLLALSGFKQSKPDQTSQTPFSGFASRPEPISRSDFLRYALSDISLDPNTVHTKLFLHDENRGVTYTRREQRYPDHSMRFSDLCQVLSREELTGRCYWELEWSGVFGVRIAVSYKDIKRKGWGVECCFGQNNNSWALDCCKTGYSFYFNNVKSKIPGLVKSKIGIYLDHSTGVLSFYSVEDQNMTLLHRVQTQFTRPLLAGIGLSWSGTAYFPKLL